MTTQYKKFTRLIAKWPIDNTKGERLVRYNYFQQRYPPTIKLNY